MAYNYMTQAGYDKLIAEINELESVQRPEISRQIAEARDKGDLSENAEIEFRWARSWNMYTGAHVSDAYIVEGTWRF